MSQKFLIRLAPSDECPDLWEAAWRIEQAGFAVPAPPQEGLKTFDARNEALQWLDGEAQARGFSRLEPVDLETRVFVSFAVFYGAEV